MREKRKLLGNEEAQPEHLYSITEQMQQQSKLIEDQGTTIKLLESQLKSEKSDSKEHISQLERQN